MVTRYSDGNGMLVIVLDLVAGYSVAPIVWPVDATPVVTGWVVVVDEISMVLLEWAHYGAYCQTDSDDQDW